jgi:SAM-dependent methyltransferase
MSSEPATWHHGLMAEWWSHFNDDFRIHERDYYLDAVSRTGGPVLDAGCGTGRVLVPLLDAGFEVDGCDQSADMVAVCRDKAAAAGHQPRLAVQALHELDLGRRYRTIVVVGVFGLGSTPDRDIEALHRLHAHLEPGGTLLLDLEVPWSDPGSWSCWTAPGRQALPEPWPAEAHRRQAPTGATYTLANRIVACDPMGQRLTYETRIERWRDGGLEAQEQRCLDVGLYVPAELRLLLEAAGFVDIQLHGEHERRDPQPDDDFIVFVARR